MESIDIIRWGKDKLMKALYPYTAYGLNGISPYLPTDYSEQDKLLEMLFEYLLEEGSVLVEKVGNHT